MEYTTRANLKTHLGITDDDSNDALDALITRCSKQFDRYLGRNLGTAVYTEYIVVDGDDLAITTNGPITEI